MWHDPLQTPQSLGLFGWGVASALEVVLEEEELEEEVELEEEELEMEVVVQTEEEVVVPTRRRGRN